MQGLNFQFPRPPGNVARARWRKDYHFVTTSDFQIMINDGALLEYAKVFDHYYGTPSAPVMAALTEGRDMLFDIDWQGTQQLADASREDLVRFSFCHRLRLILINDCYRGRRTVLMWWRHACRKPLMK